MHAFHHAVDGALQGIIPMEILRLLSGIWKFCACFIHQITWLHYINIIYRLMIPKIIGFVISQYDSNLYLLKFGKVVITIQRHNPSKFSILHMLLLPNIHVLDISYKIGINSVNINSDIWHFKRVANMQNTEYSKYNIIQEL